MDIDSDESGTDLKKDQESQDDSQEYDEITDYDGASESASLKGEDASNDDVEICEIEQAIDDPEATRLHQQSDDKDEPNDQRVSLPLLSKYERAKILGLRAEQINNNSPIYITLEFEQLQKMNALDIAELQLSQKRIPFIVRRLLPNGQFENWKLSELEW